MLPDFGFHHVGIAVFDIDATAQYYVEAGYEKTETIVDPIQNVRICFLKKEGMPMLELVAPVDDASPVVKTLAKGGVSPYHSCYRVHDIPDAVARLKKKRFILLGKPVEACAINNKKVCFMYNREVGLIELVEE